MTELETLLERAWALPPPTKEERDEQALWFTYGNLAASTNHKPSLVAFWEIARDRFGWSPERFIKWADGRQWRSQ
jgi:hypothetical protein